MGPKGQQSFYNNSVKRDVTTIAIRTPVAVSNRFKDLQVPEKAMFEEPIAEEVESVKDRELPVTGKAVKGQKLPLKGTPPVIGKETLAEGRWSTPVSVAFHNLQVPEFEMFGTYSKIRTPEESACEKLQNETAFQSSMFGNLADKDIVIGATMDSACGAGEDIVIGETMDSACGADPDFSPIGLKSYEMGDILHCSDMVTTPIVSQRAFRSRFNRKSLCSGFQGCGHDHGNEPVVRDRTKLTTPLRWKVEDLSGVRPVPQAPQGEKIVGTIVSKSIVSKKLSYKDIVTTGVAVESKKKDVCIGGRALREAPHVRHGGVAQVPVIGTAVPPTDRLYIKKLGMLGIRMPSGLNIIEEAAPEWEEIEMAVDSGASESVVNEEQLSGVETLEGKAKKMGVQYEVADGTLIPNLGEKKYIAVSDTGVARHMKSQVCEVNKALLSVHRCVQAGNKVVFAASGSYIEDEASGEVMPLQEKGGMYMLRLWVKAQGFGGPAGEQ